jgi:hypothetical protein
VAPMVLRAPSDVLFVPVVEPDNSWHHMPGSCLRVHVGTYLYMPLFAISNSRQVEDFITSDCTNLPLILKT